jgi:hypothetical protein
MAGNASGRRIEMSKIGNHVVELQERPAYQEGWRAAERGETRHGFMLTGVDREAWMLGFDACKTERDAQ